MKPKTKDFLQVLERIAPSSLSETWDNPGLQVGSLSREVEKIVLALDPTLEAVRETAKRKAQVLLNHHPLFFRPISCLNEDLYPGCVVREAVARGISIVAVHTNLDAAAGGINDLLSSLLRLQKTEPLCRSFEFRNAGIGRIGNVSEPLPLAGFVQELKDLFLIEGLRIVGNGDSLIRRAAIVGGSGGSMIGKASEMGADVLVTGDITHHQALEAKGFGLALVDAGHFRMEQRAFSCFADTLRKALKEDGFEVEVENYQQEEDPLV